jgi:hypothetical protein
MRKRAKLLANFLGSTKELMSEYVDLAEITDSELNQIKYTVMERGDRKTEARRLAAKGLSTREIATLIGWKKSTIANDLKLSKNGQEMSRNGQPSKPSITGGRKKKRAEKFPDPFEMSHRL